MTHTSEPWSVPHFATSSECNCQYILSDNQSGMGAIATVHFAGDSSDPIEPCGHQNEPMEVAQANAKRIVDCINGCQGIDDPSVIPELVAACEDLARCIDVHAETMAIERICKAVEKVRSQ